MLDDDQLAVAHQTRTRVHDDAIPGGHHGLAAAAGDADALAGGIPGRETVHQLALRRPAPRDGTPGRGRRGIRRCGGRRRRALRRRGARRRGRGARRRRAPATRAPPPPRWTGPARPGRGVDAPAPGVPPSRTTLLVPQAARTRLAATTSRATRNTRISRSLREAAARTPPSRFRCAR